MPRENLARKPDLDDIEQGPPPDESPKLRLVETPPDDDAPDRTSDDLLARLQEIDRRRKLRKEGYDVPGVQQEKANAARGIKETAEQRRARMRAMIYGGPAYPKKQDEAQSSSPAEITSQLQEIDRRRKLRKEGHDVPGIQQEKAAKAYETVNYATEGTEHKKERMRKQLFGETAEEKNARAERIGRIGRESREEKIVRLRGELGLPQKQEQATEQGDSLDQLHAFIAHVPMDADLKQILTSNEAIMRSLDSTAVRDDANVVIGLSTESVQGYLDSLEDRMRTQGIKLKPTGQPTLFSRRKARKSGEFRVYQALQILQESSISAHAAPKRREQPPSPSGKVQMPGNL